MKSTRVTWGHSILEHLELVKFKTVHIKPKHGFLERGNLKLSKNNNLKIDLAASVKERLLIFDQ